MGVKKRVMIISWKWKTFEEQIVNDYLLGQSAYQSVFESIADWDGQLFDQYLTFVKRTDGEKMDQPEARIVRLYSKAGPEVIKFLLALITYCHEQYGEEIFLFLHRRDGFTQKEVSELLQSSKAKKCFLFGDGRDFLYYPTALGGVLGDNGSFYYLPMSPSNPEVLVSNESLQRIYQPYFDKVWFYYDSEFGIKFFELKEDLLSHFYKAFPDEEYTKRKDLLTFLTQDRGLLLRVKSFIDDAHPHKGIRLNEEETEEIEQLEKRKHKSYIFDDCQENLKRIANQEFKEYQDVSDLLHYLFFGNQQELDQPFGWYMREVQREFEELLLELGRV